MKIELCLLTVNLLAGLAEVTWYLQSLTGEKKVKLFLYFNANKEDECENYKQSRRFWLDSIDSFDSFDSFDDIVIDSVHSSSCYKRC
jgi:hypothetical protein